MKALITLLAAMLALSVHAQIIRGPVTTSADGRQLITNDLNGMRVLLGFYTNGSVIFGTNTYTIYAGTNVSVYSVNVTNLFISADIGYQMSSNIAASVVVNLASSPNRILSLFAPPNSDTNWFGPWTPGTVTAGIQEAINSLPRATGPNVPGGGRLVFTPGVYYTTTNIFTPSTTNPFCLSMEGPGMTAGGIVYVGGNAQNVITVGSPQSHTASIFSMRNMFMASAVNSMTNILELRGAAGFSNRGGGIARGEIRFCYFGYWNSMTNNKCFNDGTGTTFPAFTPSSCGDSSKHNLIGIRVDLNFNDPISIVENSINYCQVGISWACDHGIISDNTFEHIGNTFSLSDWPVTSPYYTGPTIALLEPSQGLQNGNKDWRIRGNNYVGCPLHFYADLFPGYSYKTINNTLIQDDSDESGTALAATTGAPLTFLNPRYATTVANPLPSYYVTNTANLSTWNTRWASNSPPNESNTVSIVDLRLATSTMGYTFGGTVVADGVGIGTNGGTWKFDLYKPSYRMARFISTDDDALLLLGSKAGGSNMFWAATGTNSGLGFSKFVLGRTDNNAGVGTAIPILTITPSNGAAVFAGPISGDGSGVTSVNASQLQGITTNNLASAYTNTDLSLTIQAKLNLTNPPAIRGFYLWTNSAFPTAADVGGSSFIANSNGVTYILSSSPFSTAWTATNKIAP